MLVLGTCLIFSTYSANAISIPKISKSTFVPSSTTMKSRGNVFAPLGHIQFCNRNPSQCRTIRGKKQRVKNKVVLNAKNWSELKRINYRTNSNIRPISDQRKHGTLDVWSVGRGSGDCEDYALRKRHDLIALGWPSSALMITTALDHLRRPHAVLLVRTSKGDFILDNLTNRIRPWRHVPYRWAKRQSEYNPKKWVRLSGYNPVKRFKNKKIKSKAQAQRDLKKLLKRLKIKPVYKKRRT